MDPNPVPAAEYVCSTNFVGVRSVFERTDEVVDPKDVFESTDGNGASETATHPTDACPSL